MKLKEEFGNDLVDFHSCAHGGTRDKLTTIWQSKPWFTALGLKCNKQHRRESWQPKQVDGKTVFPTAQEAAYLLLLCERIIDCIYTDALEEGVVHIENLQQQMQTSSSTHQRRIAMGAYREASSPRTWITHYLLAKNLRLKIFPLKKEK